MRPRIIYIMGVSGSGKTTIGKKLSEVIHIPFFDGDDFHSRANKEKMQAGHPLDDSDRADWLISLNNLAREQSLQAGAIIACSALKKAYRTILSEGIAVPVDWVLLQGSYELIRARINARKGHFMPQDLLPSQFEALEMPENALLVDVAEAPAQIVEKIVRELDLR